MEGEGPASSGGPAGRSVDGQPPFRSLRLSDCELAIGYQRAIYCFHHSGSFLEATMSLLIEALTANEAASVTRVPLKQVHRIIDAGLLSGRVETRAGSRMISGRALVGLRLAHLTADTLTLDARRRIISRVLAEPTTNAFQEDAVTVAVEPIAADVDEGLQRLDLAKAMVTSDPATMGGAPCFAGTRIPVHDIADMMANGDTAEALAAAYPQLSGDQIKLAAVYATAYPRRGRPPFKPAWRKGTPTMSKTLSIDDLPPAS